MNAVIIHCIPLIFAHSDYVVAFLDVVCFDAIYPYFQVQQQQLVT